MDEMRMNKSNLREIFIEYDESKVFKDETIIQSIKDELSQCSESQLANTYEYLNKWIVPDWLRATLNMPNEMYANWAELPHSVQNRTIAPLMAIIKPIIIKRFVETKRTTFGIESDPWETWAKGE